MQQTAAFGRAAGPAGAPEESASVVGLVAELLHDALDLLELESRAAATTLALLVFVSVAGACFALFAWLGLSAIAVTALVGAGWSLPAALAALAAVNAVLALVSVLLVRRLARSILFANATAGDG